MGGTPPCASCKLLRRRCAKDCIFAPFFPSDEPQKFAIVHKVFGASNVSKMLQDLPFQQRADAVSSLVYEANARIRDPVYGCVGAISQLQNQVKQLQMQLAMAHAEILCFQMQNDSSSLVNPQLGVDDDSDDNKSFLLNNNMIMASIPQSMNFSSSSSVFPESLKRESLWI
ncbi:LOB domain-containing protein 12-like [Dendrobium catenatum]|uniref:LOB domain-containing protein 12 n=1 Tax=Dendrobium catenatum TaxID=906689 RepID=A0A2I0VFJ8_9ASPA|nr:LOB domain-containing protein 12-like [Dendrobium catenatum]PKU62192.1 LOB domain-containing protein 12 [Dendrobium catenatum]